VAKKCNNNATQDFNKLKISKVHTTKMKKQSGQNTWNLSNFHRKQTEVEAMTLKNKLFKHLSTQ